MGNENMYNNAASNDKCPKCGAVRPFSAIRCPACGADSGSVEAIFLGAKLFKTGSYSTPVPGVVMFVITDESFNAKLFGTNLDTFFDDITLSTSGLPAGSSITQVADMVLSGKSYRTYRMSFPMEGVGNMDMYMCARAIGNRIVLFYLYSIPGYYDINTVKGYFIK